MMKKIFLYILLLSSISASAQVYQSIPTWYQYKRFRVTDALAIPRVMPPSLDTANAVPMYFDTSDSTVKIYYGGAWLKMGGNNITIIDTTGGDTMYIPNPGGSTSPVNSVFGRIGNVTKQAGDYNFSDLGNRPNSLEGYGITNALRNDIVYSDPTWLIHLHINKIIGFGGVKNSSTVLYGDYVFRDPLSAGSPQLISVVDGQNSIAQGVGSGVNPIRINVKHFADSLYKKAGSDSIYMRYAGVDKFMWRDNVSLFATDSGANRKSQNLADVPNKAAARYNLGIAHVSTNPGPLFPGAGITDRLFINAPIYQVDQNLIPNSIFYEGVGNNTGFIRFDLRNLSNHPGAAAGMTFRNDVDSVFQFYMGSKDNYYVPNGALLRNNASGGFNIVADNGSIAFSRNAIKGFTGQEHARFHLNGNFSIGEIGDTGFKLYNAGTTKLNGTVNFGTVLEYSDNAAALAGGLTIGTVYRTGDVLKIVH